MRVRFPQRAFLGTTMTDLQKWILAIALAIYSIYGMLTSFKKDKQVEEDN